VANEIADFLAEAGEQTGGLEEIREFIAACRRKAGGDDVVYHPQIIGDALELSVYTAAGECLDSLTVPEDRLPPVPKGCPTHRRLRALGAGPSGPLIRSRQPATASLYLKARRSASVTDPIGDAQPQPGAEANVLCGVLRSGRNTNFSATCKSIYIENAE
jgi:hypothetical protein